MAPIVAEIRDAVDSGPSGELVVLIERAIGHVVKVILHADDSDGLIGDLARELLDLHARTLDAGVADPLKLARWMVRFGFDDQDFFVVDRVRYAGAVGERGLAAYRREVQRRREAGDSSFAVRYAEERLAVLDGDIGRIVRLHGGDLTTPYQFIRLAEAMEELGRDDDVLRWALRGIAERSGWQVAQPYDLAAGVHTRRGTSEERLRLRREQHERIPSSATYDLLRKAAEPDRWAEERAAARAVLAARDPGALVDVLLADGEPDAAWRVAVDNADWEPGPQRWLRLAEAREPSAPGDALEVYLRLADAMLETAGRAAYTLAIALLRRARRAAASADRLEYFRQHLASLRHQHRRRPTFVTMLDKAALA